MAKNLKYGFYIDDDGKLYQKTTREFFPVDPPNVTAEVVTTPVNFDYYAVLLCEIKGYGFVFTTNPEPKYRNVTINEGEVLCIGDKQFTVANGDVRILKRVPRDWWVFSYKQLDAMLRNYRLGNCGVTEKGLRRYNSLHFYETFVDGHTVVEASNLHEACKLAVRELRNGNAVPAFMFEPVKKSMENDPEILARAMTDKRG